MVNTIKPLISSKFIFYAELFRIAENTITYSDKVEVHNDVLVTPSVIVFPVTDSYELYLISEYRYLLKKNVLAAVAGNIEYEQKPLTVAQKELREEAGIEAEHWEEVAKIDLSLSIVKQQMHMYMAKDLTIGTPSPEQHEIITVMKIPLKEAVKKVFSGEITHGPSMLGILMLDLLKKENKI